MPRGVPRKKEQVPTKAQSSTLEGVIKPSDLRTYEGPLYVKNNTQMRIVHDDTVTGATLTLTHKGGEEDVASLPRDVALHPGFQKLWRRGDLTVSTDPALEDTLFLTELRQTEIARLKQAELSSMIEGNPDDKSLVQETCLQCKTPFFIPQAIQKAGRVPLCVDHESLSPLFTMESYFDDTTKEEAVRWIPSSVGNKQVV
jgi:hypothetical protein